MSYEINTTNQPEGSPTVQVDDAEFIDLSRMGLVRKGVGDVDADGLLKKTVAKDAPVTVTSVVPGSMTTPGAQATVAPATEPTKEG